MINVNYWYHLTNHYAGPDQVLTLQDSKTVMAPLSLKGQDASQLWRFQALPQFGHGWYRIYNKARGDQFSLDCSETTAVIAPIGAFGGQEWHITELSAFGPDWHRLTNHFITEAKSLDSSKTEPTVGLKGDFGGQEWRFTAMIPVTNLPSPPKELNQFYKKYVTTQGVHILGTKDVSDWAMLQVEQVLQNMILSMPRSDHRDKVKGQITVVICAADMPSTLPEYPYAEQFNTGDQIANLNYYRGGATGDGKYVFVTEEMLCRIGVKSRQDGDQVYREFDQVVHEWGHAIEALLNLGPLANEEVFGTRSLPAEQFAWATEKWFNNHAGGTVTRDDLKNNDRPAFDFFCKFFDPDLPFYPTTLYHRLLV